MTQQTIRNLILVPGDQLTPSLPALSEADPERDRILMAEVAEEAGYTNHHRQKLVLIFSAMRHFAAELEQAGWGVHYHRFDPEGGHQSLGEAVRATVASTGAEGVVATQCGEWRLDRAMREWQLPVELTIRPDNRFFASVERFQQWSRNRKQWRMEYYYRELRRETGLLMDDDGQPKGGAWNLDASNRKKWKGEPPAPPPFRVEPDATTRAVMEAVETHLSGHIGRTDSFGWAVTREEALGALEHFLAHRLPWFGDFQDAMADDEPNLFHALLSPYLNIGLLLPGEVCEAAQAQYDSGHAPLNAVEGFIRQILGWREFVRGLYWTLMPGYADENRLGNTAPLPAFYWTGDTRMRCMAKAIGNTLEHAYAHHIQRLMVTGNFALLAGVHPEAICDWYLGVYVDAFDWVERPNTQGMVMHADGGILGSKPYAASGKYINRMSDHCRHCPYNVNATTGPDACPFNSLYWHFIDRHREHFKSNPRMGMIYRNWDQQGEERRTAVLAHADHLLSDLDSL
ncbi:cryptochrome/photolyase family protein [Halomonadaceae bacterium KBTZ08]